MVRTYVTIFQSGNYCNLNSDDHSTRMTRWPLSIIATVIVLSQISYRTTVCTNILPLISGAAVLGPE